jgi:tape measure domain-containing protein
MASDGQVIIDLLFPGNKTTFKTDYDWADNLIKGIGKLAGKQANDDFKQNMTDIKNEAGDTKNQANKSLGDIKKEVHTKLIADAEEAGIKNFRTLLNHLPKEEVTKLEAKAEKGEAIDWREEMSKMPRSIVTKMKLDDKQATVGLQELKHEAKETSGSFSHLKEIIAGSFVGQAIYNGIQSMVSGLKEATQAGLEYNKEQDTMKTVWTSLTTETPKDGKVLVDYINSISQHSIYAADTINKMAQSFYHVHSNVAETEKWTHDFVELGSTLHMSNDELAEAGELFSKMMASGKATSGDIQVMINRFPMFGEALQNVTGKSMSQIYALTNAGKLSSKTLEEALDSLGEKYKSSQQEAMTSFLGMSMYIKARWSVLWGDITKTSFTMSKKARGDIRDLLSDDMLKKYAAGVSSVIADMTGWVTNLLDYINNNKKTIIEIIGNLKTILGIIAQTAWKTFIDIIYDISSAFGLVSDKGKEAGNPLKQINDILEAIVQHKQAVEDITRALVAFFMVKKASDFLGVVLKMKGAFKDTFDWGKKLATLDLFSGGSPLGSSATKEAETATETATTEETLSRTAANAGKTGLLGLGLSSTGLLSKIGSSSLMKSVPYLATGYEAIKGFTSNKTLTEKAGGSTGAIVGGAAGYGLGQLSNFVLPGSGAIVAPITSAIGSWAGEKFGPTVADSLKKAIEGKPVKVHVITPKVKAHVSVDTKQLQKSISDSVKSLNKVIAKPSFNSADLAKERTATLKNYQDMGKAVDDYYSKKKKKAVDDLNTELKNGDITKSEYNKEYKQITDYYNQEAAAKKKSINKMISDSTNYHNQVAKIENNSNLSQKQKQAELLKLHGQYVNQMVKDEENLNTKVKAQVQKGAKEQKSIYEQLIKDKGKLNEKDLKATQQEADKKYKAATSGAKKEEKALINSANNEYKQQKKAADDSYNLAVKMAEKNRDARINSANRQYKDLHTISKSQYDDLKKQANDDYDKEKGTAESKRRDTVKSAQQQRSQTRDAALNQYSDTTTAARNEHAKVSAEIEQQRQEVTKKSQQQHHDVIVSAQGQAYDHGQAAGQEMSNVNGQYSSGFEGMRKVINWFIDSFNGVLNALHKGWGEIPEIPKHANGSAGLLQDEVALVGEEGFELAHDPQKGIYALGANGPEIRHLQAGTSILPHEQSKKFLEMTSLIPHHAGGVLGTITKTYDWAKDKIGDIADLVSKGASGAVKWLADKVGLNSFLGKFDAAQYNLLKGTSDLGIKDFTSYLGEFFKKYDDEYGDAGGSSANPGGSGVQRWKDDVKRALAANGLSTSAAMVAKVLRQIKTESGGNPNARQPGADPDGDGSGPALGLMQTKRSTFNANAFPGHKSIFNGYDNLLAALRYAKRAYGPSLSFLGNGHGYAFGGAGDQEGYYKLFEGGHKEHIVPNPDVAGIDRTYAVLGQAAAYTAAKGGLNAAQGVNSSALEQAVNKLVSLQSSANSKLEQAVNKKLQVFLDTGKLVGGMYPKIDQTGYSANSYQQRNVWG